MSTLLNLKQPIPELVVNISDSEGFAVRGLTPYQVFSLYSRHSGELSSLFDRVMASVKDTGQPESGDIEEMVIGLLKETPTLLAELIVLGSGGDPAAPGDAVVMGIGGEPLTLPKFDAAVYLAKHLTLSVQADALDKIGTLTFTSDMPPGKFFALVIQLATAVTGAIKDNSPQT